MRNQTLEEWKTEYVTKEKIEDMMMRRNITEEEAVKILNKTAEHIYIICVVQPMTGPTGKTFKLKYRPSTFENPD
jgi:hypothetical protein